MKRDSGHRARRVPHRGVKVVEERLILDPRAAQRYPHLDGLDAFGDSDADLAAVVPGRDGVEPSPGDDFPEFVISGDVFWTIHI